MKRFFTLVIIFFFASAVFAFVLAKTDYNENDVELTYFRRALENQKDYSYLIVSSKQSSASSRINMMNYNSEIANLAKQITSGSKDDYEKVYKIYRFVYELPYRETTYLQSAMETISYGGDCADKSLLFSLMLDSIGINSYVAESEPINFTTHSFNLVYINGKWNAIDILNFFENPLENYNIKLFYNNKEMRVL